MRVVLKTLLTLGFLMVMAAMFIAIDRYATDERKEAFQDAVDARAEEHDELGSRARKGDFIGTLASVYKDMRDGIFKRAEVSIPDMMPPPPAGWERRKYVEADGERLTGEKTERGPIHTGEANRILRNFWKSSAGQSLGSAMTYTSGDSVVIIRLQSKMDHFRLVGSGTASEKRKMLSMKQPPNGASLFVKVDGHPVGVMPQFTRVMDRVYPTGYRRFVFSIGHIVDGEVLAYASDADLVRLLSGIDFASVQAVLDEPTERYVAGRGVEWPGDTPPSAEPPPLTMAFRAHQLLRAEGGLQRDDFETLRVIARGQVATWEQLAGIKRLKVQVSPDVEALLGDEPSWFAVARMARANLAAHRSRLDPDQIKALNVIAKRMVATRTELREQVDWRESWDPAVAEVIAMLPE